MKERLIELLKNTPDLDTLFGNEWEEAADYLLANGVIVPPCKVGDTVYIIYSANGSNVDTTICNGQILMENKKLTTLDEQEIYDKARKAIEELKALL